MGARAPLLKTAEELRRMEHLNIGCVKELLCLE